MVSNLISYFRDPKSRVIGFTFFSMSILFGTWISRVPGVQSNLNLSDGGMGLALMFMSLGGLSISVAAALIFSRISIPQAMFWGVIFLSLSLIPLVLASSLLMLCIALLFFGLANGIVNVAMNTAASTYENEVQKNIMSTCHGMFSFGAMLGAGLGSLLVGKGVSGIYHFVAVSICVILLSLMNRSRIFSLSGSQIESQSFSWPPKAIWTIAFIALCAILAEGVVANWSGIYLENTLLANDYLVGLGFAGFSACMAIGRFCGDSLTAKFGMPALLKASLLLGTVGMVMAITASAPWFSILGFSITGLGLSVVVPIIFSMAAKIPGIEPSQAIAAIAGIGIVGFLAGPPIIGFIADVLTLRMALWITALFTLLALLMTLRKKH